MRGFKYQHDCLRIMGLSLLSFMYLICRKKNLNPLCHLGGSFLINTATFPPHVTSENTGVCHNVMMPFDNLHSVAEGSNC